MNNLAKENWIEVRWILKHFRGTTTQALCLRGLNNVQQGYIDLDMLGDKDNRRSITWYVFTMGGTTISWIQKLYNVVLL